MEQKMNPSYNAQANMNRDQITLVRHLPELPLASSLYANEIFYKKSDTCFYRCVEVDGVWTWEKVTHGMHQRYVLSAKTLTKDQTYDDCYDTLDSIVAELYSRYDVMIEGMTDPGLGYRQEAAIELYNRLAKHVNKVCIYHEDELLTLIDDPSNAYNPTFDTDIVEGKTYYTREVHEDKSVTFTPVLNPIKEDLPNYWEKLNAQGFILYYVNGLIDVVNPHADVNYMLQDLLRRVFTLEKFVAVGGAMKGVTGLLEHVDDETEPKEPEEPEENNG